MKLFSPRIERFFRRALATVVFGVVAGLSFANAGEDAKILRPTGTTWESFGYASAMEGNRLVVAALRNGAGLLSGAVFLYDVTDPQNPVLQSELKRVVSPGLPDRYGNSVAISGNFVLVGSSSAAFLFDISNPVAPVQKTTIQNFSPHFGLTVALEGNVAAIQSLIGVHLWDLSDPDNPVEKAVINHTFISADENGLAISNGRLLFGDARKELGLLGVLRTGAAYLYDITDLENPVQQSEIAPNPGVWEGKFGSAAAFSGDLIFIGEEGHDTGSPPNLSDRRGAVSIYDISAPANPVWESRILPDSPFRVRTGETLAVVGDELLIGGGKSGAEVGLAILYDVSDPVNPAEIARFEPSDSVGGNTALGFGFAVAYNGSVAAVGAPNDSEPGTSGNIGSANLFSLPRISIPDLEDASDTGESDTDNVTKENLPAFFGTAFPGITVKLLSDVDGFIGAVVPAGGGSWSKTVDAPLSDGVHQICATDGEGFFTDTVTVTIDTTAPAAPTSLDLAAASDSGTSDSDNVTSNNQPVITGDAENGMIVTLSSNVSGAVGTGTASSSFSIQTLALGDGTHSLTAKATDPAGNESAASALLAVTIDTTGPSATVNQASGQSDPVPTLPIQFDVVFSEPVFGFTHGDVTFGGTTTVVTAGLSEISPNDGSTYRANVHAVSGDGLVNASVAAGVATDLAGNANTAATSSDNEVRYDAAIPAVTIRQVPTQADPARLSPIRFEVTFSELVIGFEPADVSLAGTAGATSVAITGDGPVYELAVSGMTGDGTVVVSIGAGAVQDAVGKNNTASTSGDNLVTFDQTVPTVTINQAAGQLDPAAAVPVNFTVQFSEPVFGFSPIDLDLGGSANPSLAVISEIAPNDGTTFQVAVSGMTRDGTVTAGVKASAALDGAGNLSVASTSSDNAVIVDASPPSVILTKVVGQADPTSSSPIEFLATFSEPVTGFENGDVSVTGTAGATGATVTETGAMDGTAFDITVTGMTGEGTVVVEIPASGVVDQVGKPNTASTSPDNTVEFDTHGGTRAEATALAFGGSSASAAGSLEGSDLDYFEFELTEALHLSIFTEGSLDTLGKLFDGAGTLLNVPDDDDNDGDGNNFRIDLPLLPGTYFVEVSGKGGNQSGGYTLRIEQGLPARIQPDNRIGKSLTNAVGDDKYGGLQRAVLTSLKGKPVKGVLGIENDGEVPDGFTLQGTRGTSLFKVTYKTPTGNETAKIIAGEYETDAAGPGDPPHRVTVEIRPKRSQLKKIVRRGGRKQVKWKKKVLTIRMTSTSLFSDTVSDEVLLQVKTK